MLLSGYTIVNGAALTETMARSVISISKGSDSALKVSDEKNFEQKWLEYPETGECQAYMKEKFDRDPGWARKEREFNKYGIPGEFQKKITKSIDAYCKYVSVLVSDGATLEDAYTHGMPMLEYFLQIQFAWTFD